MKEQRFSNIELSDNEAIDLGFENADHYATVMDLLMDTIAACRQGGNHIRLGTLEVCANSFMAVLGKYALQGIEDDALRQLTSKQFIGRLMQSAVESFGGELQNFEMDGMEVAEEPAPLPVPAKKGSVH